MKVLIVKVSALGDVVHALPVLGHLHAATPGVEVDWLVERSFAPLLEGHPLVHRVITLDTKAWRTAGSAASLKGGLSVLRQLRSAHYDVAIDLQGNSKSGLFTRLCGAARRYGFDRQQAREWPNLLATNRKVAIPSDCHHITNRYLHIARAAFPADTHIALAGPLPVQPAAAETITRQLADVGLERKQFLIAHYGTTWTTKLWPLENWQQLAAQLTVDGRQLVLTWGNDAERAAAEAIRAASGDHAVIWPRGTLPELVALLEAAQLVVGADTGPVHIAAAVGTPTVSIYRVTDGLRNGPRGERHITLQTPLDCAPCLRKTCNRDTECGESITVERVLAATRSQLEKGAQSE